MLPDKAQFKYLAELPESKNIGEALNNAMRAIEDGYEDLRGALPKNYQLMEEEVLRSLVKIFSRESLNHASGDIFGHIYEYFILKFATSSAQEGGEFFTPPSLVNLIVHIIEPDHGVIHDPACGSGGMFVHAGHYIEWFRNMNPNEAITVYGLEKTESTSRLARMNLVVHGLEGKILKGNTYYEEPFDLLKKCDFVMANPPFNVNGVDKQKDTVKEDPRLPFGVPMDDNANYMWIQYFYSYLNNTGRAGFVMAASATDAGHSQKEIRNRLIETGHVDVVVSIANNFFYTRSLPCHLWFFDKGKPVERKNKVLMIDARNAYRKVNQTLNDFTEEHLEGLSGIARMYRGENLSELQNAWLRERFPEGEYQDVAGLCKVVEMEEIVENDYSLTPGRYVGIETNHDLDSFDYEVQLLNISERYDQLSQEASVLDNKIKKIFISLL